MMQRFFLWSKKFVLSNDNGKFRLQQIFRTTFIFPRDEK